MKLVQIAENPLPPGGAVAPVTVRDGVVLRVATWRPDPLADAGPLGTVAVLPGRGEFIEKYAEVTSELLARGFAVVVLDWRGQGASSRLLPDRRRGHVRHFDDYRADLDAVATQVMETSCPRPFFALAHSMGGAIVLDHARQRPLFERIVLSAPMLGLSGLRWPQGTRAAIAVNILLGRRDAFIPGAATQPWSLPPFEGNPLTSDPARYAILAALAKAAPDLQIGGPTIGWVEAAFRVMAGLARPGALDEVTAPVLAIAGGADRIVANATIERVVAGLKIGSTVIVRHALHEILVEQNVYRDQFWAAFDRFIPGSPA